MYKRSNFGKKHVSLHGFKKQNEPTYVFIINQDLKMNKGKIASQVAHTAFYLARKHKIVPYAKTVILKAEESSLRDLIMKHDVTYINDAGRTQIPPHSLTCVGFLLTPELEKITRELKLL